MAQATWGQGAWIGLGTRHFSSLFGQIDPASFLESHSLINICEPHAVASLVSACQPQVVFHLAAQPLVRRSYRDPLGTWATNVQGSLNVLEALKSLDHPCVVVMVTTDKVYANREWDFGYREDDRLGGCDPYSASKAAAELAISSWRHSFCGLEAHQNSHLAIATARAGNVIGGGDWAEDRIFPDAMRSLASGHSIPVRCPSATRPWQHVLEPLSGYLLLAEKLAADPLSIQLPSTSVPLWKLTAVSVILFWRSSPIGPGPGKIFPIPLPLTRLVVYICKSTKLITNWVGAHVGPSPKQCSDLLPGTKLSIKASVHWNAVLLILTFTRLI